LNPQRVLVTGGSGLLGSYVVRALIEHCEVSVFDLKETTEPCRFIQGNVLDRPALAQALANQDAVIHLAALDAGIDATDSEFMRINVEGTWNLFDCAHLAGIEKVVQCSSVAALGIGRDHPPQNLPIDETHSASPTSAYGLSKLIGEQIAHRFAAQGMQVICLRPTLVMQPEIIYDVAKMVAQSDGTPLPSPASHPQWRSLRETISGSRAFVDPRDAATAFRAAVQTPDVPFGIFYVSNPETCSALPTLTLVEREFGIRPTVKDASLYASRVRASLYDIGPTVEQLGWHPIHHWDSILAEVLSTTERD